MSRPNPLTTNFLPVSFLPSSPFSLLEAPEVPHAERPPPNPLPADNSLLRLYFACFALETPGNNQNGGPAFIKWGQWAASRQDLFPRDLCEQLEMLQSSAPEHSFWYTKKIVERSLGMPIHELFDTFDESALASGSIGQVHRATLGRRVAEHSSFPLGTPVVVKVKHAGVDDCIRRDFAVMMAIAELVSRVPALEHLRLKDNLHQFAAPLREQV